MGETSPSLFQATKHPSLFTNHTPVSFSCYWQQTFVLLHLRCDLDLHQQSQKPQRRKILKWIICCVTGYNLQLCFWVFQDPRTFVWAHGAFFPSLETIIQSLFPLFSHLVSEIVSESKIFEICLLCVTTSN